MGILSALFPGPAAAGKVVETAANVVDKFFYTKQEQAEDAAKAKQAVFDQYLRWLEATSGQNRTRRAIALMVSGIWGATWVLSFGVELARPWVSATYQQQLHDTAVSLQGAGADINPVFMIVLTFYFGHRLVGEFIQTKKEKSK